MAIHSGVHITGEHDSLGTGFLVRVPSESIEGGNYSYLLTAHHVIDGIDPIYAHVPNPFGSGETYPQRLVENWRQPILGLDLALVPIEPLDGQTYAGFGFEDQILPFGRFEHPLLGAPIHYVGLFAPTGRMMARSGTAGALDQIGMPHGKSRMGTEYTYTSHLIDCRSYGGFSGSPCFVEVAHAGLFPVDLIVPPPAGLHFPPVGPMLYITMLCGMFTEHYSDENDPIMNPVGAVSRYGVGVMLRGDEIKKALMTDDLRRERAAQDAEKARTASPPIRPTPASVDETAISSTEELMSWLLQVPKAEADRVHDSHDPSVKP